MKGNTIIFRNSICLYYSKFLYIENIVFRMQCTCIVVSLELVRYDLQCAVYNAYRYQTQILILAMTQIIDPTEPPIQNQGLIHTLLLTWITMAIKPSVRKEHTAMVIHLKMLNFSVIVQSIRTNYKSFYLFLNCLTRL